MTVESVVSCRIQCRGVGLFSTRVPLGICTGDCVLCCFGCPVANFAAASSASFIQLLFDGLHRTSHTFPLQCIVLPMSLGVLWRDVRLAGLVISRQCTFLLLPSQRNLVSVPSFERTFEGSQVVAPDPFGSTRIPPRRLWLLS